MSDSQISCQTRKYPVRLVNILSDSQISYQTRNYHVRLANILSDSQISCQTRKYPVRLVNIRSDLQTFFVTSKPTVGLQLSIFNIIWETRLSFQNSLTANWLLAQSLLPELSRTQSTPVDNQARWSGRSLV